MNNNEKNIVNEEGLTKANIVVKASGSSRELNNLEDVIKHMKNVEDVTMAQYNEKPDMGIDFDDVDVNSLDKEKDVFLQIKDIDGKMQIECIGKSKNVIYSIYMLLRSLAETSNTTVHHFISDLMMMDMAFMLDDEEEGEEADGTED